MGEYNGVFTIGDGLKWKFKKISFSQTRRLISMLSSSKNIPIIKTWMEKIGRLLRHLLANTILSKLTLSISLRMA